VASSMVVPLTLGCGESRTGLWVQDSGTHVIRGEALRGSK
jgi:hypothetical protein